LLGFAGIEVPALPPYAWPVIGFAMFFVAAMAIMIGYRRENQDLRERLNHILSACPNLELIKAYVDERTIFDVNNPQTVIGKPFFAHARFHNNPTIRSAEAEAKDIVAEITFFNSDGKNQLLEPLYGRWEGTQSPSSLPRGDPTRDLQSVKFEVSGLHRDLDIALKYLDEDACYAYNNESYFVQKWKKPEFVLQGKQFQVRVRLRGQWVDKEWWFTLHNPGQGQGLKIEATREAVDWQASAIQEVE
jgi:hypothetical protein